MVRIKATVPRRKGRKRVFKKTAGQFGKRKNNYRQAIRSLKKGMAYSYRDRKVKKRDFRALWIVRLNAACREEGITYSRFINGLKNANVEVNRKLLADLAVIDPVAFSKIAALAKQSVSTPAVQAVKA
ncbi:MAG: 50S ribosomal protein L20 [Candidatus Omnitrophota bacterium]